MRILTTFFALGFISCSAASAFAQTAIPEQPRVAMTENQYPAAYGAVPEATQAAVPIPVPPQKAATVPAADPAMPAGSYGESWKTDIMQLNF